MAEYYEELSQYFPNTDQTSYFILFCFFGSFTGFFTLLANADDYVKRIHDFLAISRKIFFMEKQIRKGGGHYVRGTTRYSLAAWYTEICYENDLFSCVGPVKKNFTFQRL